jgi:hypothetical protein
MTDEDLLGELEDVMRTMPPVQELDFDTPAVLEWLGRAGAVMGLLGIPVSASFDSAVNSIHNRGLGYGAKLDIQRLLQRARYTLRMKTVGPLSRAVGAGEVFQYFDEVRKLVESASSDLLFVDPYLDAEFVARYLPFVKGGVTVRLLCQKGIPQLLAAVQAFSAEHGTHVQIRSSAGMHDRYVIVDGSAAYHSGASFKDGAKKAPTTLTQVSDVFSAVKAEYEGRWAAGQVHL